ncbi:hypothetical protein CesoFtcFv8_023638 [Champsocephalus esox]|uniref:Uncharacterized protein n=1 Tax=Champsocephalus esox TaxID=159716 RepID=A0AAN8B8N5_9TELE|nr:hypothetical protein CesoFtcFv8_023638 [Champsocephalus esox]
MPPPASERWRSYLNLLRKVGVIQSLQQPPKPHSLRRKTRQPHQKFTLPRQTPPPSPLGGNLSEEMYTLTLIPVPAASTYSLPSPPAASQPGKRKKGLPTERSSSPRRATSVADGCGSTTGEGMKKRNKGCRKCSRQQIFHYNGIKDRRVEKGREEVMVCWLPCTSCGRKWEDTWEPASQFSQVSDTKGL